MAREDVRQLLRDIQEAESRLDTPKEKETEEVKKVEGITELTNAVNKIAKCSHSMANKKHRTINDELMAIVLELRQIKSPSLKPIVDALSNIQIPARPIVEKFTIERDRQGCAHTIIPIYRGE